MLTKNAVGNLINRYKAVLDNCRLLNVLGALALAGTVLTANNANATTYIDTVKAYNPATGVAALITAYDDGTYSIAQGSTGTVSFKVNIDGTDTDFYVLKDSVAMTAGTANRVDGTANYDSTVTTFIGNSTTGGDGGAIRNSGSLPNGINGSTFIANAATNGGAIYNVATIGDITNSTFIGNKSQNLGGAISNNSTITNGITNSTFIGNTAGSGGAIYTSTSLTFNANNGGKIEFTDNKGNNDFNAIHVESGSAILTFNLAGNGNVYWISMLATPHSPAQLSFPVVR